MVMQSNVMLIEPNEINRSLAAEILKAQQYCVGEAPDFWAGISSMADAQYDVLLLDKTACLVDAEKVYNKILMLSVNMPIILFCANLSKEELKHFMMLGVYGFINKPYNRDRLLSHVGEAVLFKQSLDRACFAGG